MDLEEAWAEEAEREQMDRAYGGAPAATLGDAHDQWHAVNGNVVCPLDCGIGEW